MIVIKDTMFINNDANLVFASPDKTLDLQNPLKVQIISCLVQGNQGF